MKRFAILSGVVGFSLLGCLIVYSGWSEVAQAVASAGWVTALIVLVRAVAITGAGLGWWILFPTGRGLSARVTILLRFVREAVNQLLPVGQIGGDVVGARLATFWRCDGALVGAATIADVALQAATQFAFAIVGLGILIVLKGDGEIVRVAAAGLALAGLAIAAFFVLQARVGSRWIGEALRKVAGEQAWIGTALVDRLYEGLRSVYADPWRVGRSAFFHMGVWFVGALEVYAGLHVMGFPVSFAEAVVIESLGQAIRGAAFAIPGGVGVQEGGYIALCGLFGVPPGPALALSLVKRVPDIALGLPFLLVWQVLEGRRAFKPADAPGTGLAEGRS